MASDKKSVDPRKFPDDEFELFSIPAYDEGKPERILGSEIGSSKQILQPNDVLISRIVPHIRRAWVVPESNGLMQIGSSEWIIFRANDFYPEYLQHYLLSDQFNAQFISTVAGVGGSLLRARPAAVAKLKITLPEINEQKRVAAILDKADEIKTTSIKIQDSRIRIIQSAFVKMFGDPIINPNNYPKILFGELGTLDRGKSKHRPRNDPRLLGGNHPLIQTGEIRSADLFVDTFTSSYSDFGLAQSRKWPVGTLAITIAANIAESAILGIEACFPDSIVGFTPNSDSNSVFIKAQLDFLKDRISEVAPQSAQKNINLKILRKIPMMCPPVKMQEKFEDFVRNATLVFDSANKGIDMAEELAQSSVQSLIN